MVKKPGRDQRGSMQNARLFNRDGWKCAYCGYDGDGPHAFLFLELDHIDPATKTNDDFDLEHDDEKVTVCIYCNKLKASYQPKGATREEKLTDARAYVQRKRELLAQWYFEARTQS